MMPMSRFQHSVLILACVLMLAGVSLAQSRRPAAAAGGGPPAAAPAKAQTLAEMLQDHERLLYALGERDLDSLLDHAFKRYAIPADNQPLYKTFSSLRRLTDTRTNLSTAKRQELVNNVVAGIDRVLEKMTDSRKIMELGTLLLINGTARDLNTLEYWGRERNEAIMDRLRPVAEAVSRVYAKAADRAKIEAELLANRVNDPQDPRLAQVDRIMELNGLALYNKAFNDYTIALCLDASAKTEIDNVTQPAISALKEYDNPKSGVQNAVRTRIGKLYMARNEYADARTWFDKVIGGADAAREWGSIYEAKYFRVLCDLLEKKLTEAGSAATELGEWQARNIPASEKAALEGAEAALRMLEYRIAKTQYEQTKDKAANERSIAILLDLMRKRPDLRSIILVQLASQLPANPDVQKLDPLLLRAMVGNGEQEARRDPADIAKLPKEEQDKYHKTLEQALAAGKEIMARKETPLSKEDLEATAFLVGLFYDLLDQDLAGATAYLDFIQKHSSKPDLSQLALRNAEGLISLLRRDPAQRANPGFWQVYDRFLDLAVRPPFNRQEFAFEYGMRLLTRNQNELRNIKSAPPAKKQELSKRVDEVIALFAKVPAGDKRHYEAQFFSMMAQVQKLDLGPRDVNAPERVAAVERIQEMAATLDKMAAAQIQAAADDAAKSRRRLMHVRTSLTAAGLAMSEKRTARSGPNQAVELLKDYEEDVKGMPDENGLLGEASYIRFQALMELKQEEQALKNLETFLDRIGGDNAIGVVQNLLEEFDKEYDKARRDNNTERAAQVAGYRATLSGRLVERVRKSENPEIKKYLKQYQFLDLRTKRAAAAVSNDPEQKKQLLAECLKIYEDERTEAIKTRKAEDPYILGLDLNIGLVHFDLGNWVQCHVKLHPLVTGGKTGTAMISRTDKVTGQPVQEENPQYWETTYKWLRSRAEILKMNPMPQGVDDPKKLRKETESKIMELYTLWGEPGGEVWFPEFEKLRLELVPDWKPKSVADIVAGTTQPAEKK